MSVVRPGMQTHFRIHGHPKSGVGGVPYVSKRFDNREDARDYLRNMRDDFEWRIVEIDEIGNIIGE